MDKHSDKQQIKEVPPEVEALVLTLQQELKTGQKRTNWAIGKELTETLGKFDIPQEHKKLLICEWEETCKMDYETLCLCMRFYELHPDFDQVEDRISWEHYAVLVTVPEGRERIAYEEKVFDQNLSVQDLKNIIQKDRDTLENHLKKASLIIPMVRIEPFIYRLKEIRNKVMVDLGLSIATRIKVQNFLEDGVVKIQDTGSSDDGYKFTAVDKVPNPHYIYKAHVLNILDDDVLELDIHAGFGVGIKKEVRLRGVYSRPMASENKQRAREYIEGCLKECEFIAVRTYWQESFESYLADVFYDKDVTDFVELTKTGKYLNQELLDKGLAGRYFD